MINISPEVFYTRGSHDKVFHCEPIKCVGAKGVIICRSGKTVRFKFTDLKEVWVYNGANLHVMSQVMSRPRFYGTSVIPSGCRPSTHVIPGGSSIFENLAVINVRLII